MTKTCGECKHYIAEMFHCQKNDVMAEPHNTCEDFEPKVITNGDKIRQMGNSELAKLLLDLSDERGGTVCARCDSENCLVQDCKEGVIAWLNAPAESEGEDE